MFSCNSIYPLPHDGAFSPHISGDHDDVSRYKSYYQKDKLTPVLISIVLPICIFSLRPFNYYSKNEVSELFWSSDSGDIGK